MRNSSIVLGTLLVIACADRAESIATTSEAVTAGLVAAWGFNEGSGLVTADASGNRNNGTLANATWTSTSRFGGALSFNGTNARVLVPDSASLDLSSGMTLEAWVRPAALDTAWRTVVLKEFPTTMLAYALYANQDATRPAGFVNVSSADQGVVGSGALALNAWSHVATTYDGATLRIYVGGTLVASRSVPGSITVTTGALGIGGNAIWGEYFSGQIDEVRIYNRALSVAEIQQDMTTPITDSPGSGGGGAGGAAGAGRGGQAGAGQAGGGRGGAGAGGRSGTAGVGQGGSTGGTGVAGAGNTGNTGNVGGTPNLTVNGNQPLQRIDGFGVSANSLSWDGGELIPALDLLLAGGSTLFRVSTDNTSALEPTNDNADPNVFNWPAYRATFTSPQFEELWSTIAYLNARGIHDPILVTFGPAPTWMGGADLAANDADEFAEMFAALLYYARFDRNLSIAGISPFNEPDHDGIEGPRAPASVYVALAHRLAERLDALDMSDIRFIGPEPAFISNAPAYTNAMTADALLFQHLRAFAVHYGVPGSLPKPWWVSEFVFFEDAVAYVEQGASAVMIWDAYDSVYNHAILAGRGTTPPNDAGAGVALLAYNATTRAYTPRPVYYDFAQLAKWVGRGSVRVSVNEFLQMEVLAFHQPTSGRVTIVSNNRTSSTISVAGSLVGLSSFASFQQFHSGGGDQLAAKANVPVTSGRFSLSVPSGVTTLTGAP